MENERRAEVAPLAVRMRPRTLDEVVGQTDAVGPGSWLRSAIESDSLSSVILFGPAGTGKTSLAHVIAEHTRATFVEVSAIGGTVSDLRREISAAEKRLTMQGLRTILFVDEIHRFNRSQQDALLHAVENRVVVLVGATTENPFFEVNSALISRSRVVELHSLTDGEIAQLVRRALADERGLAGRYALADDALSAIVLLAGGDGRASLTTLELASQMVAPGTPKKPVLISVDVVQRATPHRALAYDKNKDMHYDVISAFIKSMRGSDPDAALYWLARMLDAGVTIVGGCCGTTPKHIAALTEALKDVSAEGTLRSVPRAAAPEMKESAFFRKLRQGEKPIAVEFDPSGYAAIGKYIENAKGLCDVGADVITIADCPTAKARMDSSLVACMLQQEGIETLPHMTCRDRNLNASQALLMGLSAAEVQNLLIVTGDPIPTAERDEVKSVYQFNSRKMAHFIRGLEKKGEIHPFHVFGALNINAMNFDAELGRAEKKIEKGMQGLLTQPVLSRRGLENLRRAKESLDCYILGGIMPVISERNARFMNSEVNGIDVEEALIQRYVGLNREEAENLALEVSVEIGKAIASSADGFYVITPFSRVSLVSRIVEAIRDGHVIS